mgnify:FL=1
MSVYVLYMYLQKKDKNTLGMVLKLIYGGKADSDTRSQALLVITKVTYPAAWCSVCMLIVFTHVLFVFFFVMYDGLQIWASIYFIVWRVTQQSFELLGAKSLFTIYLHVISNLIQCLFTFTAT